MPDDPAELLPIDPAAFATRYGPRALVAGGATGMGAEYCRQIAAMGIDLVILDRDAPALDATARDLRSAPNAVDVVTAVVDLGLPPERLLHDVRQAIGELEIGLLVANAAWSPVGPFLDSDLSALLSAIDINCRAPVVLVHEIGTRMAARGRGGIIVMSSLAAETGTAQVALYSATKAFDLVLAEGLWYELRDRGVDVVAIRPGSTRTPGWESTQPASGELDGVMEPSDVVRDALAALGTTPSIAAGVSNRAAEAMFRRMTRRDVIELMSRITSRLVAPDEPGYSLVGLLLIVVVLGLLTATAIVGVNALTDSGGVSAISTTTVTIHGGSGGGTGAGVSSVNACRASADAARSASTLYFANSGGNYPSKWADLTAASAPLFALAQGVVINPAKPAELEGRGWKLVMVGGGTTVPTFTCS
jgi:short-subunit dehydrogenase